jgi:hypothetical protein
MNAMSEKRIGFAEPVLRSFELLKLSGGIRAHALFFLRDLESTSDLSKRTV